MDPKEYAARLQRMRDEIETAKAREKISNSYNKAMETSPMEDAAERLYAEFKAKKKPASKKAGSEVAAPSKKARPVGAAQRALAADNADEGAYVALGQKQHDETMADQSLPRSARLSEMMRHEMDRRAALAQPVALAQPAQEQPSKVTPDVVARIAGMPPEKALQEYYNLRGQIDVRSPSVDPDIAEVARLLKSRADSGGAEHGKGLKPTAYVPRLFGGGK